MRYKLLALIFIIACGQVTDLEDSDGISSGEHRVFVSSLNYNGNLGGLSGADSKCANLARSAGLSRDYIAILSSSLASAESRLTLIGPIFSVDSSNNKILIASSELDLWSGGNLVNDINLTETGSIRTSGSIWSGSSDAGGTSLSGHCNNWTNGSSGDARAGSLSGSLGAWIDNLDAACTSSLPIYCISI